MHDRLRGEARSKLILATRGNFLFFLRRAVATVSPRVTYQHNWHIEAIGEQLADVRREISRG